jgi:hypothetical protein
MSARAYVWVVLALCAAFLVPVATLNLMLLSNALRADKNRLASEWQQATRGVTYAPPISYNRPFKTLRLNDRVGQIDTIVFGSSTTMGLTEDAFPPPRAAYNFAQSGNSLLAITGEAEYVADRWGSRVKLFVIPLDWALGFVFERGEPVRAELTREAVDRAAAAARPSYAALLTDALSAPRLKILASIARDVLRAPDTGAALRQVFLDPAGPEYRCADGTPARDFDVVYRGLCNGFRYDGSATFADQKRLDVARAPMALAAAVSGGGQYASALRKGRGEPSAVLLGRLARLARRVEDGGGAVLLLLPPLMPGMEEALAGTGHSGGWLRATQGALVSWAARERIPLLDAGRSERYGCVAAEFIDPHHALPACYRKVFERYFREHPGFLPATAAGNR